jgi:hypothetical protein
MCHCYISFLNYVWNKIYTKMDLGEIGWGGVDLFGLVQNREKWRALVQ